MRLSAKQVRAIGKLVENFNLRSVLVVPVKDETAIRIYTGKSSAGGTLWYKVAFNGEEAEEPIS